MARTVRWAIAVILLAVPTTASAQPGKFTVKTADTPAPKELSEAVRQLLDAKAIVFQDAQGKAIAELWFCKEIAADATPEQIKKGLTYREVKETTLFGAVRFVQNWTDYRKQKVKTGVYTLRLGFQPMDGDHMGSSEHLEFLIVVDADKDAKPAPLDHKKLNELSQKSIKTGHPASFMLFPNPKPANEPQVAGKPRNHWVVNLKRDVTIGGKKAGVLGIGLTLVGEAE